MARIFILLCLVFFTSCFSTKSFLDHDQIPKDFGKDNKPVFIVQYSNKRINNIIIAAFEKYYKGPYSVVTEDEVLRKSGYVFHAYMDHYTVMTSSGHVERDKDLQFQLKDLMANKIFQTYGFASPKTKAKYYIQALEIVRQRNQ